MSLIAIYIQKYCHKKINVRFVCVYYNHKYTTLYDQCSTSKISLINFPSRFSLITQILLLCFPSKIVVPFFLSNNASQIHLVFVLLPLPRQSIYICRVKTKTNEKIMNRATSLSMVWCLCWCLALIVLI